jgi:hypothetical protein
MLKLIKNIEGSFVTNVIGNINYVHKVNAELQNGDYIHIYGLTGFLQNLSTTEDTAALVIPNLFGYSTQFFQTVVDLDFSTCNKKATWYNMQESPDYMMGLSCGVYSGPSTVIFTINSFVINGIEKITTPLSASVDSVTANWIPANNTVVSACTGTTTGLTYTDFVDFLNTTFWNLGVNYRAVVSLVEVNLGSNSNNGFYLIYPENDVFSLSTASDSGFLTSLVYTNGNIGGPLIGLGYYKATDNVDYDCETNTITE